MPQLTQLNFGGTAGNSFLAIITSMNDMNITLSNILQLPLSIISIDQNIMAPLTKIFPSITQFAPDQMSTAVLAVCHNFHHLTSISLSRRPFGAQALTGDILVETLGRCKKLTELRFGQYQPTEADTWPRLFVAWIEKFSISN